jgi:hypothetical protein
MVGKAMYRSTQAVCVVLLALPVAAYAASEFDGTWKTDLSSWKSTSTDEYLLKDGTYTCLAGCIVKQPVPADGAFHSISGSPYSDALAATPVDKQTLHLESRKNGAKVADETLVASADGKTLTIRFVSSANTNGGPPVTGTIVETRMGDAPAGSHAISGTWQTSGAKGISENAMLATYKLDGDLLTMTAPTGQSYTAVLGGPDAPFKGDPGANLVAVRRVGPHAIEETDKLNDKTVWIGTSTVSDDGKTMTTVWQNKLDGGAGSFTSSKQ